MSLRWRADGRLLCAAKCGPEEGDTYIDDRLHHQLNTVSRMIIADVDEATTGLWHWVHGPDFLLARDELTVYRERGEL